MRYDNWDVILFPQESAVPIQEFRTACYTTYDERKRPEPFHVWNDKSRHRQLYPLPLLTCFQMADSCPC